MMHGVRLSRRRYAALALISLAVSGILLPEPGRALAATEPGTSLAAGYYESCAIEAGQGYCWGPNANGELGDGSTNGSSVPVAVDTSGVLAGKTLTQISTADGYSCALDKSGAAYCWGSNEYGRLGFGIPIRSSDVPLRVNAGGVLAGKRLVQITTGELAACALDSTGHAYCWGNDQFGELGNGRTADSGVPVAVSTSGALAGKTLTQISGGSEYTCALDTTGAAYCWGANRFGDLGVVSGSGSDLPVPVDASGALAAKKLVRVAASQPGFSTCAIDASGLAYCWGFNFYGQLGDGRAGGDSPVLPVAVDTSGVLAGKKLTQISTGFDSTCALDGSGAAYCWGDNYDGQLGDGGPTGSIVPVPIPVAVDTSGALAGTTLTQIGVGGIGHACAMSTSGAVYCWGSGFGSVPVAAGPSPVTGVAAVPGKRFVRVSWRAPVMPAGLTGYTAIANPGEEICVTRSTSCTIGGLRNDTTYSVTVFAHTATINSAASALVSVTPGSRVAFTSTPHATAAFGHGFRFTVRASGGSPVITLRGTLPPGVSFARHANGTAVLAGTPDHGAVAVYRLTFTAKSRDGVATQAFTLAVTRAPSLAKLPSVLTFTLGENVNVPVKAAGYPVPQLIEAGQLPPETFLDDHGNGTGTVTGQVNPDTAGAYHLTVIAASTSGEATHSITVIVVQPPSITSPASVRAPIGLTLHFKVTATGFPAPKITESGRLPTGVTFSSATATLSGIPRSGTSGSYSITFTATNAAGTTKQHFTLTVT